MSANDVGDGVAQGFGFRLRFRTNKGFTTTDETLDFDVEGHRVTLASPDWKPLVKGGWYSLKATGFADAGEARALGTRVLIALQIASIRRMLGVDVGEGVATSALSQVIVDALAEQGSFVRSNVHGLDVFEDRPGTAWFNASLEGSVSTRAEPVFADLADLVKTVRSTEPPGFDAVRLLNEALVSGDAAAQFVLAVAAVETLAQGGDWSPEQRRVRQELADLAATAPSLSGEERAELSDAIVRVHRLGIMEGFRRLLRRLMLERVWPSWRDLYKDRSKLLHGMAYAPPAERSRMVAPALLMAALIVLTFLEDAVPGAGRALDPSMTSLGE